MGDSDDEIRELPVALRAKLDAEPVRLVVEYLGRRLGADDGVWTLEFRIEGGYLRRTFRHHTIGTTELEVVAMREAPPIDR